MMRSPFPFVAALEGAADADARSRYRALRREVRTFLADELAAGAFVPRCDSWLNGWDAEFSRRLAGRGWVGMTIPAEYGGHGRDHLERFAVTVELLAAGAPVAAHWFADRQTAPSLLRYGSDYLKRRFLPAIAAGECFFALGMSEPDSGSDLASIRTRAVPTEGGWRINGRKVWTSGAHHAHFITVLCRTAAAGGDRHDGLSQLIVPLDAPGVQVRPIPLLTGERHFNEVVFDDVVVPEEMVLGVPGAGWHQVTSELAVERSGPERFMSTYPLLAALIGHVDGGIEAGHRDVGDVYADLAVLRQLSWSVAVQLAGGATPTMQAALVKDLGTSFEGRIAETARRIAPVEPDMGAVDDYPRLLAEAVLHSPGFTLRGGTSEILRQVVARELVSQ